MYHPFPAPPNPKLHRGGFQAGFGACRLPGEPDRSGSSCPNRPTIDKQPAASPPSVRADSPTDTTPHVLPPPHHNTRQPVTPICRLSPSRISAHPAATEEGAPGSAGRRGRAGLGGERRAQVGPGRWARPRGRAGLPARQSPARGSAAWAARRLPTRRLPRLGPARRRAAGTLGRRRADRGAGEAGRRPGARGRPWRPSPRPGAEQREAAQAATGPAASCRPREAAERAPERLSLGFDG